MSKSKFCEACMTYKRTTQHGKYEVCSICNTPQPTTVSPDRAHALSDLAEAAAESGCPCVEVLVEIFRPIYGQPPAPHEPIKDIRQWWDRWGNPLATRDRDILIEAGILDRDKFRKS